MNGIFVVLMRCWIVVSDATVKSYIHQYDRSEPVPAAITPVQDSQCLQWCVPTRRQGNQSVCYFL